MEQRLRMRTLEEFFGSFWSFVWAAKNCSSVVAGFASVAFSSARTLAYFATSAMRFLFLSIADVFGMASGGVGCLGFGAAEGHPHQAQEIAALFVVLGGRNDRDVEAHALLHVLDGDFREDREV